MKLDIYLKFEQDDFSTESLAVLCLINYCELKNEHVNLHLCCSPTGDVSRVLKNKYAEHLEIRESTVHPPKLSVLIRNANELSEEIKSVSLPCLKIIDKNNNNFIIYSGLATLYRAIVNFTASINEKEKKFLDLLGFKQVCLKACKEVSTWTNLCEFKAIRIYEKALLTKFENKNELQTEFLDVIESILKKPLCLANRKNFKETGLKYLEDVNVNISDLLVYFSLNLMSQHVELFKSSRYENIKNWYVKTMREDKRLEKFDAVLNSYKSGKDATVHELSFEDAQKSEVEIDFQDLSIKDSDDKIEELKVYIQQKHELQVPVKLNRFFSEQDVKLNWDEIDKQLNPRAGHLPDKRIERKCQQLENFLFLIKTLVSDKENMKIVDFCSGGGHLGILVAFFYPNHRVVLVDNKEESLKNAIKRINELKLTNIVIYKANLSDFIGNFDLGIAIHACGSATDMIVGKCIHSKASVVISPCCYGAIKSNEEIEYPLSSIYQQSMKQLNLKHHVLTVYSDRTEKELKYEAMAVQCMELVDTDRILHLKDKGYKSAYLTRLLPENCTLKNNVIVASFC